MIWFLNPFWEIYGKRLKRYDIDQDFIIFLKPFYEDVNDYDFYLSLIKMKSLRDATKCGLFAIIPRITIRVSECTLISQVERR